MANWEQVQENWEEFRGRIQRHWPKLTDEDLEEIDRDQERLLAKLQKRLRVKRPEAEKQVKVFLASKHRPLPTS